MPELQGKVALVTGGLSGIGRAICELFDRHGASLVILDAVDVSRDDGTPAAQILAGLAQDAAFVQGDVAEPAAVDELFGVAADHFGRVDVLVNNAGVTSFKPVLELSVSDLDRVLAVNVRGTFLCCQRAIAQMRGQDGRGTIVNVASNFGFVGAPEASAYCASKGAVATLTKALAVETGRDGIRINALCPGATATEFNREHRGRPEVMESWAASTPLRRPGREEVLGTPDEIAEAALFLAGPRSSYMTGSALLVDGGWNAA
jgi:NAD(P)-dependent dehydrogenase (short-subunit alcohol dehydrogenase family)